MIDVGRKYVFDFDSTLTRVEALDVLAEMTLQGNSKREQIIEAAQAGVNGYIVKPFTAATLNEKLGKIFERIDG